MLLRLRRLFGGLKLFIAPQLRHPLQLPLNLLFLRGEEVQTSVRGFDGVSSLLVVGDGLLETVVGFPGFSLLRSRLLLLLGGSAKVRINFRATVAVKDALEPLGKAASNLGIQCRLHHRSASRGLQTGHQGIPLGVCVLRGIVPGLPLPNPQVRPLLGCAVACAPSASG